MSLSFKTSFEFRPHSFVLTHWLRTCLSKTWVLDLSNIVLKYSVTPEYFDPKIKGDNLKITGNTLSYPGSYNFNSVYGVETLEYDRNYHLAVKAVEVKPEKGSTFLHIGVIEEKYRKDRRNTWIDHPCIGIRGNEIYWYAGGGTHKPKVEPMQGDIIHLFFNLSNDSMSLSINDKNYGNMVPKSYHFSEASKFRIGLSLSGNTTFELVMYDNQTVE